MEHLTVSQVARASGVKLSTVRYYERLGIVPPPPRSAGGYRRYSPEAVDRIRFVRHAQQLGFSLSETKQLLALWTEPHDECGRVRERAERKLTEVEKKIVALRAIRADLAGLIRLCRCHTPDAPCPLLRRLESSDND